MFDLHSPGPCRRTFLAGAGALALTAGDFSARADSADLVLTNAQVWSGHLAPRQATAVAISSNRILAVGPDSAMRALAKPGSRVVDMGGRFVMPGFNDSHLHMTSLAQQYDDVVLLGSLTLADVVHRIQQRAAVTPPGQWILARAQWHEALLAEGRMPTRKDLDPVSPDNPVYIPRGGHVVTVNSKALQLAGITRDTPNPPGGIIVRDANGEPTGMLLERAHGLVDRLLPPPNPRQYRVALQKQIAELNQMGLTSLTNPSTAPGAVALLKNFRQSGELTIRVNWTAPANDADDIVKLRQSVPPFDGDRMLRFSGIGEVLVDGGVEGAFLRDPYNVVPGEQMDPAYRGVPMPLAMDEVKFEAMYLAAIDAGYNFMTHITGDAALDMGLRTLARVKAKRDFGPLRWVLHGCFLTDAGQLAQVKKLGLYITGQTQPYLLGAQMAKWWGRPRADRSMPFQDFLDAGIPVGGGSDAPAGIAAPMESLGWMVNRLCLGNVQYDRKYALTPEEALTIYTSGSARTQFMEDVVGRLAPGMLADLTVLADNPLKVPTAELATIPNDATLVDGRVVFDRHKLFS